MVKVSSKRESALLQLVRDDETFVALLHTLDRVPELLYAPAEDVCSAVREILPTAMDLRIVTALDLLIAPARGTRAAH